VRKTRRTTEQIIRILRDAETGGRKTEEQSDDKTKRPCLDRELPYTMSESRVVFADRRDYTNNIRPHRSLGLQSPSQFARNQSTQALGAGHP